MFIKQTTDVNRGRGPGPDDVQADDTDLFVDGMVSFTSLSAIYGHTGCAQARPIPAFWCVTGCSLCKLVPGQ